MPLTTRVRPGASSAAERIWPSAPEVIIDWGHADGGITSDGSVEYQGSAGDAGGAGGVVVGVEFDVDGQLHTLLPGPDSTLVIHENVQNDVLVGVFIAAFNETITLNGLPLEPGEVAAVGDIAPPDTDADGAPDTTTTVALLLCFLFGALLWHGYVLLTVALALMVPGIAWVAEKRPWPALRWLAAAVTIAATDVFMSAAPRPNRLPSRSVGENGSLVQRSSGPGGTTSTWPARQAMGEPWP